MRARHSLFPLLLLSLHYLSGPALAQEGPAPSPTIPEAEESAQLKCQALLDEVLADVGSLKLAENRAWVQAQAAAILWKRDETRARRLFENALASLDESDGEPDDESPGEPPRQRSSELRREILRLIAGHDIALMRKHWRAEGPDGDADEEAELDLDAAALAVGENPPQAIRLARESISHKVSFKLVALVSRLQKSSPGSAGSLAGQIIERLKSEDLASNQEAAGVAAELFRMSLAGETAARADGPAGTALALRQEDSKALAEMLAAAALRASPSQPTLLLALQPMLPHVEGSVPSLARQLRRQVEALNGATGDPAGTHDPATIEPDAHVSSAGSQPPPAGEQIPDVINRATAAAGRGEKALALQLLDEAGRLAHVFTRARSYNQLNAQFEVALAYMAIAPPMGFDIFDSLIAQLDELASAAVVVDGFLTDSDGTLARRNELLLTEIQSLLDRQQHGERIHHFTRADFARTVNAIGRFQRPELRLMARLSASRCASR